MSVWTVLVSALVVSLVFAGCTATDPPPADVRMSARWQGWHDDNMPHLMISLTNYGGQTAYVGPGGMELSINGPIGTVPIHWGDTNFARPIHGGQTVSVAFHPRMMNQGAFVMAIDHAHPMPMTPTPGMYTVCLEDECQRAQLG